MGLPEEELGWESRSEAVVFTFRRFGPNTLFVVGNRLISNNNHRYDYPAIPQLWLPILYYDYEMQTCPVPSKVSTMNNIYGIILLILQIFTELIVLLNNKGSNCALNDCGRNNGKSLAKAALEILKEEVTVVTVGVNLRNPSWWEPVCSIAGEGRSFWICSAEIFKSPEYMKN